MKAHGGCRCKGPHRYNHGTRKGPPLSPVKAPGTDFIRLSGPQDQSGHEGAKKNHHFSDKFQSKPTHVISHDQILN